MNNLDLNLDVIDNPFSYKRLSLKYNTSIENLEVDYLTLRTFYFNGIETIGDLVDYILLKDDENIKADIDSSILEGIVDKIYDYFLGNLLNKDKLLNNLKFKDDKEKLTYLLKFFIRPIEVNKLKYLDECGIDLDPPFIQF